MRAPLRGTAVPATRMAVFERDTARPVNSGATSRTANARRVRTSTLLMLTTLMLTMPLPKRRCGTTVHPCHGVKRRPRKMFTLTKLKIGRLSNPSGHQLTNPGADAQETHAGPQCRPGIQNQTPAEKPHRPKWCVGQAHGSCPIQVHPHGRRCDQRP